MLNAILDNVPIFYLSFFKAPKEIILEIVKMQYEFLWGGDEMKRNVNRVSWENVCKSKKQRGLEVNNCENFN